MKIREIFENIKSIPGSKAKKEFFEQHKNNIIELIFADTYDDSKKYYVHKYNHDYQSLINYNYTVDDNYDVFHDMLQKLANREVTGNAAIALVEDVISQYVEEDRHILHAILSRNLKIGLSATSFNKSAIGKIEKFQVALACNLDKIKGIDPIDGNWFASRKLDGVRCIAIVDVDNSTVEFLSRQGKKFTTLKRLEYPLIKMSQTLQGKIVFDGELCIIDEDGNEDFSKAIQNVTKKDTIAEDVRYCIFDILDYDTFISGYGGERFSKRYEKYMMLYESCNDAAVKHYLSPLTQERITTQDQFDRWTKLVKDNGWEGFMLRKDLPFESGRIKDLIKVKKFKDAEYEVLSVECGKATYNEGGQKEFDVVSAIIIEHKGNFVRVGSGLSKEQRIEWFKNPSLILGKTVTVQYFEESKNKNDDKLSLRFPVLKYVYENGRDC